MKFTRELASQALTDAINLIKEVNQQTLPHTAAAYTAESAHAS